MGRRDNSVNETASPSRMDPLVLLAIIASAAGFAFSAGMTYPVMSLALDARGFDAAAVGLNGMMTGLGLLISSPVIPRLVARFGGIPVLLVGAAGAAATLLLMTQFDSFLAWCLLRLAFGMLGDAFFVVGETLLVTLAPPARRARLAGIYTTVLTLGFAGGPALIPVIGFDTATPFLLSALVVGAAALAALPLRHSDPLSGEARPGDERLAPVMRAALPLMLVIGALGFTEVSLVALLPLYAVAEGMRESAASLPVTALLVGSACMQIPVGLLADRLGQRRVLLGCFAASVLLLAMLPLVTLGSAVSYLLLVLLGGAALSVFPPALALLGQHYRGVVLAAGSAAFGLAWGLGSAAGPPLAGALMETLGNAGLPLTLLVVYLATAVAFRLLPIRSLGDG